jgi:outer membrane protein assembly factor BamA
VRGVQVRGNVVWSSELLGSDDRFLRLLADGAAYREVRPGWVLAGRLQAGSFLSGTLDPRTGFIPPEQRFYAGGPNSVRGFERNALGPRAYVLDALEINADGDTTNLRSAAASATGGTEIAVGSLELRIPSPLFAEYLRLAGFVDAGQVWAPGTRATSQTLRVTPGAGLRFTTPIGPIRLDVAYNPYGAQPGPLFLVDENNNLELIRRTFEPQARGFLDRLQFQFAVGQAF